MNIWSILGVYTIYITYRRILASRRCRQRRLLWFYICMGGDPLLYLAAHTYLSILQLAQAGKLVGPVSNIIIAKPYVLCPSSPVSIGYYKQGYYLIWFRFKGGPLAHTILQFALFTAPSNGSCSTGTVPPLARPSDPRVVALQSAPTTHHRTTLLYQVLLVLSPTSVLLPVPYFLYLLLCFVSLSRRPACTIPGTVLPTKYLFPLPIQQHPKAGGQSDRQVRQGKSGKSGNSRQARQRPLSKAPRTPSPLPPPFPSLPLTPSPKCVTLPLLLLLLLSAIPAHDPCMLKATSSWQLAFSS